MLEGVVETRREHTVLEASKRHHAQPWKRIDGCDNSTRKSVKSSGDWSEPLQNKILRIITSKTKGAAKWKALLNGRKFRAASAVHYMNCLHSANTGTLPLIKFRGNDDKFEDS